jgi:hypothetical protein
MDCVPAGNIIGITGLGRYVLKNATLSTTPHCTSLSHMPFQTKVHNFHNRPSL